jgi:hypothetical protein
MWRGSVGSPQMKNPPDSNKFRIPYYEGSLPQKKNVLKFKLENVIKMKHKPYPALLHTLYLPIEIKNIS